MTPHVVVDIGNSRMKWGLVRGGRIADTAALDFGDRGNWFTRAVEWCLGTHTTWVIVSVNPTATDEFLAWLGQHADGISLLEDRVAIPLELDVETPEAVGLDRLLACHAARKYAEKGRPFLVVQAGTALVINLVNANGVFCGGSILPGLSLMAKSLHEHTAKLPEVAIRKPVEAIPGRTTEDAIRAGIYFAAVGAILTLRAGFGHDEILPIFITGGDAALLIPALPEPVTHLPDLVLEGIRLAAEARP